MSSQLTRISVLLLLFYMGWFMWEQNKVVKEQKENVVGLNKIMVTRWRKWRKPHCRFGILILFFWNLEK